MHKTSPGVDERGKAGGDSVCSGDLHSREYFELADNILTPHSLIVAMCRDTLETGMAEL